MLFSRSIITLSCLFFSSVVVKAAPIRSTTTPYTTNEAGFLLTESLSEYYENIVDQVMLDVSENVLSYLPGYISQGNVEVRQLAQKSMDRNLNFMRASLLASVNPLVSTDIPQITGLTTVQQISSDSEIDQEELEAGLLDSILTLNTKISHQLGLIVNAEQSSSILIRQANTHLIKSQSDVEKPTVITVEWKLRQPFQINVIREQQKEQVDMTSESEWLYNQLSSVEISLLNEFNDRVQEAVQLVMESLALDI